MAEFDSGAMRINKYLSAMGYCSRREADRLVTSGQVTVDGVRAELGTLVGPGQVVKANGNTVGTLSDAAAQKTVLIAVNKPTGIVCTTTDNDRAMNIVEMVEYPTRVYPIGRLDKDSEGLMLLTNRGDLVNDILRAANYHEKEYIVRVDKPLTEGFVDHMRRGVHLAELQVTTRPCKLTIEDKMSFRITLTQGLNRQIRRMCEALGFHVTSLKRTRIMNIRLGNLKVGTYRNVTPDELKTLEELLKKAKKEAQPDGVRSVSTPAERKLSAADHRRKENYKSRQKEYFRGREEERKKLNAEGKSAVKKTNSTRRKGSGR